MGKSCSFSEHRGPVGSPRRCPTLGPQNNVVVKLSGYRNISVAVNRRADPAWFSFVFGLNQSPYLITKTGLVLDDLIDLLLIPGTYFSFIFHCGLCFSIEVIVMAYLTPCTSTPMHQAVLNMQFTKNGGFGQDVPSHRLVHSNASLTHAIQSWVWVFSNSLFSHPAWNLNGNYWNYIKKKK